MNRPIRSLTPAHLPCCPPAPGLDALHGLVTGRMVGGDPLTHTMVGATSALAGTLMAIVPARSGTGRMRTVESMHGLEPA